MSDEETVREVHQIRLGAQPVTKADLNQLEQKIDLIIKNSQCNTSSPTVPQNNPIKNASLIEMFKAGLSGQITVREYVLSIAFIIDMLFRLKGWFS